MGETLAPSRALIWDHEALVRERASGLLALEGFSTCSVDSAELFSEFRAGHEFDLFLVGVRARMEADALASLGEAPAPLVLLVPQTPGPDLAHLAVAFPGAARIDRDLRDRRQLQAVLPRAADGAGIESPLPPLGDLARRMFGPFGLSERQLEVLLRALLGERIGEIAQGLFISEATVRNHLHSIYSRVGVSGRAELLGRFVRGLIVRDGSGPDPRVAQSSLR